MRAHVRHGKGGKDRFVILPTATLLALRRYWSLHRNPVFLFPSGRSPVAQIATVNIRPSTPAATAVAPVVSTTTPRAGYNGNSKNLSPSIT
jgi:integrase